ncbi:acyl carrier protein [Micromonospora sp. NPDC048935]|uniref:acyl carrier protein n=1 Tax=Micromonospora sp. NPDC048935 TaxID=3364262 RepID=UPI003714CDE3
MAEIDLETELTTMIRNVNGTDPTVAEPARFPPGALLYEDLDVDSLALVELAEDIEVRFAVAVSEDELKSLKSFAQLTEHIRGAVG